MIVGLIERYLNVVPPSRYPIAKAGIISAKFTCARAKKIEEPIKPNNLPYLASEFINTPLKAYSSIIGVTSTSINTYNQLFKYASS